MIPANFKAGDVIILTKVDNSKFEVLNVVNFNGRIGYELKPLFAGFPFKRANYFAAELETWGARHAES